MAPMQINPPFGYTRVAPLRRDQKVRLLAPGEIPAFARKLNAIPISFTEFAPVARDYPIVFTSGDEGRSFAPVAVLGLAAGENLYASGSGWAAGVYVPAYARRFPFCMARVTLDKVEQQNRLICVETDHVDDKGGEPMFDAGGQPLEKWKAMERLLTEYEADLERSRELCAILGDYGLLEPFTMQAKLAKGGEPMIRFPILYPTRLVPGSFIANDSRAFVIDAGDKEKQYGYKFVVSVPGTEFGNGLLNEYYGVSGTDWLDAPILDNPSETRVIDGREYLLFYDGDRLRLVGYKTEQGAYWVNNTLSQSLDEGQMLSIATSLDRFEGK